MSTTRTYRPEVAGRLEQGGRAEQLDAVETASTRWAVADGFGAGGSAARTALTAFLDGDFAGDPATAFDVAMERAHDAVEALGGEQAWGTTLTAAWLLDDRLAVAHIGDSRAWLSRDAELVRLTRDHTVVQSLLDEGALTEEEARSDPRRHLLNRAITQGLPAEADVFLVPIRAGDRLVLTTDGVHAHLPEESLTGLLARGTPQETVDAVADAVEAVGAPDNYAVVVADLDPGSAG